MPRGPLAPIVCNLLPPSEAASRTQVSPESPHGKEPPLLHLSPSLSMTSLLLGPINPGHSNVLKDDDDGEWQGGRVVIEHGDEIVSGALDEQQPHEECKDTAAHYREPRGRCGGTRLPPSVRLPSRPAACPLYDSQALPCRRALEAEVLSSPYIRQGTRKASTLHSLLPAPGTAPSPRQLLHLNTELN